MMGLMRYKVKKSMTSFDHVREIKDVRLPAGVVVVSCMILKDNTPTKTR